jgi:uncharacterized protein involved in exopolysaccharide biosynthesis
MPWNPTWELERRASNTPVLYDIGAVVSRQRKLAGVAFAVAFIAFLLFGLLFSDRYEARMEIMVNESQLLRAEPVLTGQPNAQPIVDQQGANGDQTLNSEIALLQSQNVLQEVVETCGLNTTPGTLDRMLLAVWSMADASHSADILGAVAKGLPFLSRPTPQEMTAKGVQRLSEKLRIEVLKMSNVISVTYTSNDQHLAAKVLNTLGNVYLKEHALAHYPPGELKFFEQQTSEAGTAMEQAEAKLTAFTQSSDVASGQIQLENALRRLSDDTSGLEAARASIAAVKQRIQSLRTQATQIPERQLTQLKTSESDVLLQNLRQSLLNLETKQTALLTQYQPTYPLVIEVKKQIAQTRAALSDAENSQLQAKTTDRDPNYEMVREDLTRSQSDLAALTARAFALNRQIVAETGAVDTLQKESMIQQGLMRNAKAAEDNYLMLLEKEQEARISEALDREGVFNVSIVQPAVVPQLPIHSAIWYVLCGALLSILCAFATAIGAERLDPKVRSLDELEAMLCAPVLAVLTLPFTALPPRIVNG